MQKDSGQYKKLVAGIIVGIYAFVVFFAGFLHTHKADVTFGTGTKVKMEKSFQPNVNDCLSCHLMGSHQIYESFDFSLELFSSRIFAEQIYFYQQKFFLEAKTYFSLRGPPLV
ncbi:hypothetical protein [Elizabethkingia anophelis]|uniref:hypothetical protein n=1 Tax=Elizabethkingia anophelis TaxID=1117645 RepID=UPI00063B0490|nr:hypothetical protein [Elizabethkingia anophelis]AKH93328.1 hypothetical protein M876_01940 [Elizabethkingia anophelis FMS-007]MCT3904745.1 hypothetical protein [Elizabethkingia anophelis]